MDGIFSALAGKIGGKFVVHAKVNNVNLLVPRKNAAQDDEAIGRMCAWLKKNKMVGQTTLAGKLTLTPRDEAYTAMVFGDKNER